MGRLAETSEDAPRSLTHLSGRVKLLEENAQDVKLQLSATVTARDLAVAVLSSRQKEAMALEARVRMMADEVNLL